MCGEKKNGKADSAQVPERGVPDSHGEQGESTAKEPTVTIPQAEYAALKEKAGERDRFLEQLQRTAADFDNFQKRIKRDRPLWETQKVRTFVRDLLPAVDDLQRLMNAVGGSLKREEIEKVLRLLSDKLTGILSSWKIEPIETKDSQFDPTVHEALREEVTTEAPTGTVLEEVRKGYTMDGTVLRPAQVVVARNRKDEEEEPKELEEEQGEGVSSGQEERNPQEGSERHSVTPKEE